MAEMGGEDKIVWNQAYGGTLAKLGGCLEAIEAGIADMGLVGHGIQRLQHAPAQCFLYDAFWHGQHPGCRGHHGRTPRERSRTG